MDRLSATEVARSFSAILNRVADGDEIEITRNGHTVAVIGPPKRRKRFLAPQELRELMASLPPVDEDFARDVMEARRSLGPPESHWPS
jgi:prevent-host-death family protein